MVFQAAEKTAASASVGADFSDLERIKHTEAKATTDILNAERNADRIITDAEQNFVQYRVKMIAELKAKLDREFSVYEQSAKSEAQKIRDQGDSEAAQLKDSVRINIPKAVDHIVRSVVGE